MKAPLALALALSSLLVASAAFAEESKLDEAKHAFEAGNQAYEAGKFLVAARAYENAYELTPLPSITFSIAQAYRRCYFEDPDVKWLEKAQSLYQRYLVEQPTGGRRAHAITHLGNIALLLAARANPEGSSEAKPPPTELLISATAPGATASIDGAPPEDVPVAQHVTPGKHRVKIAAPGFFETELDALGVEGRLSILPVDLKERPGALQVLAPDGADVWIDGRFVARTPLGVELELPAGSHLASVSTWGHRPASRVVTIERGGHQTWSVHLERSEQRVGAYWTFAGAGAFALTSGATAILAAVARNQAADARSALANGQMLTPDEAANSNRALERHDRYQTLSLASLGISALAAVTGTVLFVFDNPAPRAPSRDAEQGSRDMSRITPNAHALH